MAKPSKPLKKGVVDPQNKKLIRPARHSKDMKDYLDDDEVKPAAVLRDGLPHQAFAIVPDTADPKKWKLPHHTAMVKRAVQGKIGYEHTVDWEAINLSVQLISLAGREGVRVNATEGEILAAARHLANHYQKAGKSLPDPLAVLV
jgi:hypothetical protein